MARVPASDAPAPPRGPRQGDSPLAGIRVGVVGTGSMAEAMLAGMLRQRLLTADQVVCSHPRAARAAHLRDTYGVTVARDNPAAVRGAELCLLAVKPQVLPQVLPELAPVLSRDQLVVSIVAGASTRALGRGLRHPAIVRAMPNTPAQIGQGVTVWYATQVVTEVGKARTRGLLSALGREFEVDDEGQVAMATAVSGTGPTYIFLFIEALIDAAVHLGFARHVARELVLDTMQGSAAFALQSGRHVAELRDMVTSPGGTSAEALAALERGGLRTVVSDAVWAAYRRTLRLEQGLEGGAGAPAVPEEPSRVPQPGRGGSASTRPRKSSITAR
ncbi:MAG TPA: pyrroline-5-carboxylate reductase [Candidatus Micrarchaeia archaeon]|nr:pyrroline-5-carboxylate reductase [Candidatus Micrarchaeia archaeon]